MGKASCFRDQTMPQLSRQLSYSTLLAIVIGAVIGSGIFLKPASMASQFPSIYGILILWLFAGAITLIGALTNAEVACLYPETGGQYVFFKKMFGDFVAFLYGWASIVVFNTAGIASIAYVASYYLDYLFPLFRFSTNIELMYSFHLPGVGTFYILEMFGRKILTIGVIIFFTIFNCYSTQQSSWIQRFLTGLKLGSIFCAILFLFLFSQNNFIVQPQAPLLESSLGWSGFIAALAGAFWCFDGWNNLSFVAGEIKDPNKSIAKSLLFGLLVCTVIYLLFNTVLFYVLPFNEIQQSEFVAATAMEYVFGNTGGLVISFIVIISVLGAVNGNVFACSRVTYSFAVDHRFISGIGTIHPRYQTPFKAIIVNSVWACLFVLSGSFDQLTDILIFVSWIFYGLSAAGVIMLRYKNPQLERPFKVPCFPYLSGLFVVFTGFYLYTTIYNDYINYMNGSQPVLKCIVGLLLILAGVPLYLISKKAKKNRHD